MFNIPITLFLLAAAASTPLAVVAKSTRMKPTIRNLAHCPTSYINDGRKCIRKRQVEDRDAIAAHCPPGMSLKKQYTYKCHTDDGEDDKKIVKSKCPKGYDLDLHGQKCFKRCPKGYQSKVDQCVLPAATLPNLYMTCPDGQRRVNAFCEDQHLECEIANAPGKFYYSRGRCERSREVLTRDYTPVLKSGKCPDGQALVSGKYCQEPCPEYYQARKGTCELRRCVLKANKMDYGLIMCPEGSYPNPSAME